MNAVYLRINLSIRIPVMKISDGPEFSVCIHAVIVTEEVWAVNNPIAY